MPFLAIVTHDLIMTSTPVHPQNYQETIAKDTDPEAVVLRISATDADSDANGAIEYFLNASHSTDASYFSIESRTGVISLAQSLSQVGHVDADDG